jgi:multiple sugar transport system ATP-binding protein
VLDRSGSDVTFRAGDVAIPLPSRLARLARGNGASAEAALGVRPEDTQVVLDPRPGEDNGPILAATVSLVEPVGSDLYVSATTGDLAWTARAEARLPVVPGQQVGLGLDLRRAHLFGADGRNLSAAS